MEFNPLVGPVVALVVWTIIVLLWFATLLFAGIAKNGMNAPDGTRVRDITQLPHAIQWKNHNYMHLMEQPTIFYAVVFALIVMGDTNALNLTLAWGYVGLRVLHSLVQATVNKVPIRLVLFLASTVCLVGLALHAALTAWAHLA
ncbi:MAPEG family protein [Sphingomicrobium nitratireducens]|uniref:MAPEG family protein n=1 Tax=Sphingomicrobium nitratireducens TaxID=2964666 RepID=UPI0022404F32|nr:MAPEG family protein [Sphingomicrobium nitratireducens]